MMVTTISSHDGSNGHASGERGELEDNLISVDVDVVQSTFVMLSAKFNRRPTEHDIEYAQEQAGYNVHHHGEPRAVRILGRIALWNCRRNAE